jgi:hypothetical protein
LLDREPRQLIDTEQLFAADGGRPLLIHKVGNGGGGARHVLHDAAANHYRRRTLIGEQPPDENRVLTVNRQHGGAEIHV